MIVASDRIDAQGKDDVSGVTGHNNNNNEAAALHAGKVPDFFCSVLKRQCL